MNKLLPTIICVLLALFSYAQQDLLPDKTLKQISKIDSICSCFESYDDNEFGVLDSLIQSDISNLDLLLDMAYPIKHDSLFDASLYDWVDSLSLDIAEDRKAMIAMNIRSYGYDAIVALEKVKDNTASFVYWNNLIQLLVLGYEHSEIRYRGEFHLNTASIALKTSTIKSYSYTVLDRPCSHRLMPLLIKYFSESHAIVINRMHQLMIQALKKGRLTAGYNYVLRQVIIQLSMNSDIERLKEYLKVFNPKATAEISCLINTVAHNGRDLYPEILPILLENESTMNMALRNGIGMHDMNFSVRTLSEIDQIFNNTDQLNTKRLSALFLYTNSHSLAALDFILDDLLGSDYIVAGNVISHLWEVEESRLMSKELSEVLAKYLLVKDRNIAGVTLSVFLKYSGEEVIKQLIPHLDNSDLDTNDIKRKLSCSDDRDLVVRELEKYISLHPENITQKEFLEDLKK